ncbi:MAG: hypothetical protein ACSHXZ_07220 [Gammaproteobacteria bacterium]
MASAEPSHGCEPFGVSRMGLPTGWVELRSDFNYEVLKYKKTRAQKSPALRGFEEDPEYFQIDIWWSLAGSNR